MRADRERLGERRELFRQSVRHADQHIGRYFHILLIPSVDVYSEQLQLAADVAHSGFAGVALAAGDERIGSDPLADLEI